MKPDEMRRAIVTYLSWMALLTLGLVLAITSSIPLKLEVLEPRNLNILLVQTEMFFLLLVWPLFIPEMVGALTGHRDRCLNLMCHALILLILSLPLSLVTQFIAGSAVDVLLAGRAMTVAAALFVVGVFSMGPVRRESFSRNYFLALLVLTGALPYAAFVMDRADQAGPLTWFSPMWSAAHLNGGLGTPLATAALFGGTGLALVAASCTRPAPAPAVS